MIGAVLAALLPLAPSIIKGVEALFQSKPKSGPDKMSAATQALRGIIQQMVNAGVEMPDGSKVAQPTDDALAGMIETVFQQLKSSSGLSAASSPSPGTLFLVQGTITPLRVA